MPHRFPSLALPFFALVACLLVPTEPIFAATFHVAPPPTGSDAQPGTVAQPWATLQHAADQVAPGDTVLVHDGDYVGMHLVTSGTAALPIVFRAAPGAEPRVVADNPVTPDGINVEGADHVTIEGSGSTAAVAPAFARCSAST